MKNLFFLFLLMWGSVANATLIANFQSQTEGYEGLGSTPDLVIGTFDFYNFNPTYSEGPEGFDYVVGGTEVNTGTNLIAGGEGWVFNILSEISYYYDTLNLLQTFNVIGNSISGNTINGTIDVAYYNNIMYGQITASSVNEPTTLIMLALGTFLVLRKRKLVKAGERTG